MKKILSLLMVAVLGLSLAGCASPRNICGTVYDSYGVFDQNEKQNPNVRYDVSVGGVILAIILVETVIVPVIIVGWYLFEPVGLKSGEKGVIVPLTCSQNKV